MVQAAVKKMIFEEAVASGLDKEDAEEVSELAFARWMELVREEVPNRNTQFKDYLSDKKLTDLLIRAVDEVWVEFMKGREAQGGE